MRYFRKQFVGEAFAVEKIGRLKQFWKESLPLPSSLLFSMFP